MPAGAGAGAESCREGGCGLIECSVSLPTPGPLMDFLQHELNHILEALNRFHLTPWKAVGYAGSIMFTSRWFVQLYYTRKLKRVVMPLAFWWLSVCGSVLLLAYFIIGKNDSVGILSNFFPTFVSVYNLWVHLREVKRRKALVESEV